VLRLWNGVAGRLHDLPGEHDGTRRQRSAESVGHGADRRRIGGRWAAAQQGAAEFLEHSIYGVQPHHIVTLIDSQPGLTQATWGYRPPASANDTWIGTDVPSGGVGVGSGQLAFGAPVSITNYIGQTGDGVHANWLERLTESLREFNVPTKFDQSVTLTGLANGCLNLVAGVVASTGNACGSGGGGGQLVRCLGGRGGGGC